MTASRTFAGDGSPADGRRLRRLLAGAGGRAFRRLTVCGDTVEVDTSSPVQYYRRCDHPLRYRVLYPLTPAESRVYARLVRGGALQFLDRTLVATPAARGVVLPRLARRVAPTSFLLGVQGDAGGLTPWVTGPVPADRVVRLTAWLREVTVEPESNWVSAVRNVFGGYRFDGFGYPLRAETTATPRWILVLVPGPGVVVAPVPASYLPYPYELARWVQCLDPSRVVGAPLDRFQADPALYFRLADTYDAISG